MADVKFVRENQNAVIKFLFADGQEISQDICV